MRGCVRAVEAGRVWRPRMGFLGASALAFGSLAVASWVYLIAGTDSGLGDLLGGRAWSEAAQFVGQLLGAGVAEKPAFLRADRWLRAAGLAYETLAMSVLAIALAMAGVLLTVVPAARTLSRGEIALSRSPLWRALFFLARGFYIATRGVPELLWAMLLVLVLSPGMLPGALALAVHNLGILGKLCAEVIEDMDPRPARALRSAGARGMQVLAYAILPEALPQFLTYALYRWEVIIRTTVVVGFVGAGGLGRAFRLHMSWFQYSDVALLLLWYLILVLAVDILAAWLRRLAR